MYDDDNTSNRVGTKRTANPASLAQQKHLGRIITFMIASGIYESKEQAQTEFFQMTGYDSIKKMSVTNYAEVKRELLRIIKATFQTRLEDVREYEWGR